MNIIVLTGGTLGGKTTIIENLKRKYKDKIITIPEVMGTPKTRHLF